jgi:hypothetical protein
MAVALGRDLEELRLNSPLTGTETISRIPAN